ncbi:MAG TPA: hypothetical protein V6D30_14905 [Leptolyngbyaceae cyanobacterium]
MQDHKSQLQLELLPIRFITFEEVGLSTISNDRVVWRLAPTRRVYVSGSARPLQAI